MLVPKVKASEFKKFGFKRCKGIPKESECYYLCIARGCKMLFVSDVCFDVNDWNKDDPRIHKNANCRYRDKRTALDMIYELIKADMLKSEWNIEEQPIEFDVENVIEQLEEESEQSFVDFKSYAEEHGMDNGYEDWFYRGLIRAIEIVRRGGRDD